MEPDAVLGQGDYGTPIEHTCKDAAGEPVDLSDATGVRFRMAPANGGITLIDADAENRDDTDGSRGLVSYTPAPGDLDVPGSYHGAFIVTLPDGVRSFPYNRPLRIAVVDRPEPIEVP